jgi:hypothetical protein
MSYLLGAGGLFAWLFSPAGRSFLASRSFSPWVRRTQLQECSVNKNLAEPAGRLSFRGVAGISCGGGAVKIDKHDAEWKLTEGSETLGFIREWLGSYFVYRSKPRIRSRSGLIGA